MVRRATYAPSSDERVRPLARSRLLGTAPVQTAWLNRNLDSASRATVISMTGQANSIGQAAGGPAFGLIANAVSIQVALLASAAVLSPTVAHYNRLIVRDRQSAEPVPTAAD